MIEHDASNPFLPGDDIRIIYEERWDGTVSLRHEECVPFERGARWGSQLAGARLLADILYHICEPGTHNIYDLVEAFLSQVNEATYARDGDLRAHVDLADTIARRAGAAKTTAARRLALSIDELGLAVRSRHCMQVLGVQTIGDLVGKSERDLMQAKNFGNTSLIEVRKKLAALGLWLKGDNT